jgi:hypothetical protein
VLQCGAGRAGAGQVNGECAEQAHLAPRLLGGPHAKKDVPTTSGSVVWALFASRSVQETKHRRTDCPVTTQSVHVQETERLKQEERAGDRAEVASALDALK